ncbi:unnamed protein product, partial [Owenia fusiformis]
MLKEASILALLMVSLLKAQGVHQEDTGVNTDEPRYEAVRRGEDGYCKPPCSRRDLCCRDTQDTAVDTFCARRLTDSSDDQSCRDSRVNTDTVKKGLGHGAGAADEPQENIALVNQEDMGVETGEPRYEAVKRGEDGYCHPPCSRRDLCCR